LTICHSAMRFFCLDKMHFVLFSSYLSFLFSTIPFQIFSLCFFLTLFLFFCLSSLTSFPLYLWITIFFLLFQSSPWGQFHQHFTSSFYENRSQKCKHMVTVSSQHLFIGVLRKENFLSFKWFCWILNVQWKRKSYQWKMLLNE